MTMQLDGESAVESSTCDDCGAEYVLVKSLVLDEQGPYAIPFSALHDHGDLEAWIDVILGSFDGKDVHDELVTFGCRVGPVQGSAKPAATAVEAARPYADSPTFGHKLSREEALAHPRLQDFWRVVDFLLEHEPAINHHVYAHLAQRAARPRWWRRRS